MRKTEDVIIGSDGGRDAGKKFVITEMPARRAEQWADRAFLALAHSSANLPPGIERAGMAGIAQIAHLLSGLQFAELAPLMDELLKCAQFVPDQKQSYVRDILDNGAEGDDIEEVATRQLLRQRILGLHVNFGLAAVVLNLIAAASEMKTIPTTETIPMSRRRSAKSSRAA